MQPTMNNVFVKLQPLDYFFFGGRRTFGDENANYFVRSRHVPQQTALVGLLRHLMLVGGLNKDQIGESFDAENNTTQHFGPLQSLSPVFLYGNELQETKFSPDKVFLPHPLDAHKEKAPFTANPSNHAWALSQAEADGWGVAAIVENYEAKEPLLSDKDFCIVNTAGKCLPEVKSKEKVFSSTTRTGITKRHKYRTKLNEQERERGFYKQQVYKLSQGWSFGVIATFGDSFDPALLNNKVLPFGGERSLFRIQVQKIAHDWKSIEEQFSAVPFASSNSGLLRVMLLSDAYVNETVYEDAMTAVSHAVDFQNLHTPKKTTNYAALTRKPETTSKTPSETIYKSGRFTLLSAGSVFYATAEKAALIKDKLEEVKHFRGIGYNHFIIR